MSTTNVKSDYSLSSSSKPYKPYHDISFIEKVLSDDTEMMKLFELWLIDHRQQNYYTDEEKLKRLEVFKDNAKEVYKTHVDEIMGGFHECYCGLNVYSDITFEEFKHRCCGDEMSSSSEEEDC